MGEVIARLPIDVQLGKLIVLGHIFGILDEAIIIAAGLIIKNRLFLRITKNCI